MGTNIGEQFDVTKLRYQRIIIMTDADVDGAHIRTLLLTLFFRHFPDLIHQGHIFIAQPPLYRVSRAKEVHYAYSDAERDKIVAKFNQSQKMLSAKTATVKGKPSKITTAVAAEISTGATAAETETGETSEVGVGQVVSGVTIQRYKGLGEMNPGQLWETTMDPATRQMQKVTIEDAEKADEIFDILMGSEVSPRKRFIQTKAKSVTNLDI